MTLPDSRHDRDSNPPPPNATHSVDPTDSHINQALSRLNQVQPPSHFQQRLSARISRELHSPVRVPFYQRLRWQSVSLVAAGLAAAFIGGVFARPLLHHTSLQPAANQPVASHPAPPPTLVPSAQPAFNVRMADGHNAAMSPAGVVASNRSLAEHKRAQLASHGQSQDTNLGRLANKPPRPGQPNPNQAAPDQTDSVVPATNAPATTAPAAQSSPSTTTPKQ